MDVDKSSLTVLTFDDAMSSDSGGGGDNNMDSQHRGSEQFARMTSSHHHHNQETLTKKHGSGGIQCDLNGGGCHNGSIDSSAATQTSHGVSRVNSAATLPLIVDTASAQLAASAVKCLTPSPLLLGGVPTTVSTSTSSSGGGMSLGVTVSAAGDVTCGNTAAAAIGHASMDVLSHLTQHQQASPASHTASPIIFQNGSYEGRPFCNHYPICC